MIASRFWVSTLLVVLAAWSCAGESGGNDVVDAIAGSDSIAFAEVKPGDGSGPGEVDCTPDCEGKECGDDGCGGACGECAGGIACSEGVCCTPDCDGKTCGDDGCGATCGECGEEQACLDGACQCLPDCEGKACGPDGCEGTCGECPDNHDCVNAECLCIPNCEGKVCGANGCGESCGECPEYHECEEGECVCVPQCNGKECGPDLCDGMCGECADNHECDEDGACICIPNCGDMICGTDGCGGSCGLCAEGLTCVGGDCVCVPNCDGKDCDDDGCGGSCGECLPDAICVDGVCVCEPKCEGLECGDDSCGGSCGSCPCADCPPSYLECGAEGQCALQEGLTCSGIFSCLNACPGGSQVCQQECIQSGSEFAQAAFYGLIDCYTEVGVYDCWDLCPEDAQTQDDCPPEGQACFDATIPLCEDKAVQCIHGALTCSEMWVCFVVCPDTPCKQECLANGNPAAQYGWNDFLDCLEDNGYFDCPEGDSECTDLAWATCDPVFQDCMDGGLTCLEVRQCLETLELGQPDFTEQMYTCFYDGTGEAQSAYGDLEQCVIGECFTPWDQECWDMAVTDICKNENQACEDAGGPLDE